MSQRVYYGARSNARSTPTGWYTYLPWGLAVLTITSQVTWILVNGQLRLFLTIVTVVTFFLADVTHALITRGLAWTAGFICITVIFGWAIEALGTVTAFPFGNYTYTTALGPALLNVPLIVPLAWSMMAYPCLLAAQQMVQTGLATAVVGGWLFAAWDLFLDPQMVSQNAWVWHDTTWFLPGIEEIPLQNFLGWLLAAFVLMWVLNRLPRVYAKDGVPMALLSWVYVSNVLAAAVFFQRPLGAMWGAVCMGLVIIPWWWYSWAHRQ